MVTEHTTPDPDEVVEQHWPYDGPYSPEQLASALDAVAELVRYSSNASFPPRRLGLAPEVYRTTGGLVGAAGGLPQLLSQLASWAHELAEDGSVRHDQYRGDPDTSGQVAAETAGGVEDSLIRARELASELETVLSQARQDLSHLYHD